MITRIGEVVGENGMIVQDQPPSEVMVMHGVSCVKVFWSVTGMYACNAAPLGVYRQQQTLTISRLKRLAVLTTRRIYKAFVVLVIKTKLNRRVDCDH